MSPLEAALSIDCKSFVIPLVIVAPVERNKASIDRATKYPATDGGKEGTCMTLLGGWMGGWLGAKERRRC